MAATAETDFCWGTGRRKTAVARVRLRRGAGHILINGRELNDYFPFDRARLVVTGPLRAVKAMSRYDIFATIRGGGVAAQADAMALGIARALIRLEKEFHQRLKDEGLLTRDSREKERKKYGRRRARARFQFSKR